MLTNSGSLLVSGTVHHLFFCGFLKRLDSSWQEWALSSFLLHHVSATLRWHQDAGRSTSLLAVWNWTTEENPTIFSVGCEMTIVWRPNATNKNAPRVLYVWCLVRSCVVTCVGVVGRDCFFFCRKVLRSHCVSHPPCLSVCGLLLVQNIVDTWVWLLTFRECFYFLPREVCVSSVAR